MTTWVYRAEVKGIQSWILSTTRLQELQGGSAIVDGLQDDARVLAERVGVRLDRLFAAAGAVEIEFDEFERLRRFAAAWPLVVAERAPGLQVVQAWSQDHRKLYQLLGIRRNLRHPDLPEAGPVVARSGRTGLPAVGRGGEHGLLDRATARKAAAARKARGRLERLAPEGFRFATDLQVFESRTDERGGELREVAVVHIDGNGIGQVVMGLRDFAARRAFSTALAAATEEAARSAFEEAVHRLEVIGATRRDAESGDRLVPARPVVLGGDDLTAILDARVALPFVRAYLEAFERETAKAADIDGTLTAAAGIAVVKADYPFHAAHELADSLCSATKKGLRGTRNGQTPSGLLFHRVTTASLVFDWEELEAGELCAHLGGAPGGDRLVLAGGPYPLDALDKLRDLAREAAALPRGALREWLRLLKDDPERAAVHWERAREVADAKAWKGFAAALRALGHDPEWGFVRPNGNRPGRTAVGDALLWPRLCERIGAGDDGCG